MKPTVPFLNDCDTFRLAVQLNEIELSKKTVSIFPNPTNGKLSISSSLEIETIELYNISGSLISEISYHKQHASESIIELPPASGIYFLRIITIDGSVHSEKIMKQ